MLLILLMYKGENLLNLVRRLWTFSPLSCGVEYSTFDIERSVTCDICDNCDTSCGVISENPTFLALVTKMVKKIVG